MKKLLCVAGPVLLAFVILNLALPTTIQALSNVSAARSSVAASPQTVLADGTAITTITVTVRNSSSRSLSGKTVTLSANPAAVVIIVPASATSGASGRAIFTAKSTTVGTVTFTAVADGVTILQKPTVSFVAPTPVPSATFTPTATVTPTAYASPTFTPTFTASPTASWTATITPTAYAHPSASRSLMHSYPVSVAADNLSLSTITVTALDDAGNPLSGRTVQVFIDQSVAPEIAAGVTIQPLNPVTGADGKARFQVRSSTQGNVTFRAIAENTILSATTSVFFLDPSWPTPTPYVDFGPGQ